MDDTDSGHSTALEWFLKILLAVVLAGILVFIVIKAKKVLLP